MSVQEAAGIISYLQANPQAAKAAHEQATKIMKTSPGMASAMTTMLQVRHGPVPAAAPTPNT